MHIVLLVNETLQRAAHRDYVVVWVRAEHNHTLWIWFGALRTVGVVCVGLAAWPSCDGVLDVVKHLDVHVVCRAKLCCQFVQAILVIVVACKFQNWFACFLAKPCDGAADHLVVPLARSNKPWVADAGETLCCRQVDNNFGVAVHLKE